MKHDRLPQLLLDVNFNRIEKGVVYSASGSNGILTGDTQTMCTRGHDGTNALMFSNKAGVPAQEYVDFGEIPVGAKDFTLQLWMRTHRDGCNGWSWVTPQLEADDFIDLSSFSEVQKTRGGVVLSNTDFSTPFTTGFTVANMQQFVYFSTSVCAAGGTPVQITGCKEANDDRWHQITITFERAGVQRIYVDARQIAEKDISAFATLSLDDRHLVLGADATGMHGLGEAAISELRIWRGVLDETDIQALYYPAAVLVLAEEYSQKVKVQDERFTQKGAEELACRVASSKLEAQRLLDAKSRDADAAKSLYHTFRHCYEEALLGDCKPLLKFMLLSDTHIEGDEGTRRAVLEKAFTWARTLQMDAYLDAGDYSNLGRQEELKAYWDTVEKNHGSMKAFVAVGNHETLELSSKALKTYHLGRLKALGMLPEDYDQVYYDGEVNGYHFILLAQYDDYTESGYKLGWMKAASIRQRQLEWLEQKLKQYCGKGKPVFLAIHNAIAEVVDAQTDGSAPAHQKVVECDALYDILERYPDVVIATGHVHHGLGDCCGLCETKSGYHVIDVPAFRCNQKGYGWPDFLAAGRKHTGYFVYVYPHQVNLRAVDFVSQEWLTAYDQMTTYPGKQK